MVTYKVIDRKVISTFMVIAEFCGCSLWSVCDTFPILQEVLSKIGRVIHEIDMLMSNMLTEELLDWKRRQQIACIGGPLHGGLDQLQNW